MGDAIGDFQAINKIAVIGDIHFFNDGIKNAMKTGNTTNPVKSDSLPVNWFENVDFK